MKIFIDINHPAHVHYFKNFIKLMESKGNSFIITNRDSKIINNLLDHYEIKHFIRNKRKSSKHIIVGIYYLVESLLITYKYIRGKKIDLFLGFGSVSCSFFSAIYTKPSIIIDDTEHNTLNHILYKPFASSIITPFYFSKKMGKKQIFLNSFIEQFYLHSTFYKAPDNNEKKYALIRFISYDARHDSKIHGALSLKEKENIVELLSNKMKTYVSCEDEKESIIFGKNKLDIRFEQMHDIIANATVLISEGATMASEAGILGIEYYYINPLSVGYIDQQIKRYNNAHKMTGKKLLKNIDKISLGYPIKDQIREQIENETINPTLFLVWFVENYPESEKIMTENPDYQYRFK